MKLSKIEQETIIIFNEEEKTATVTTCNKALKNKLDKLVDGETVIGEEIDEYCKEYNLPKKWVKVSKPRQLSEEQKQKMANRMREMRASK